MKTYYPSLVYLFCFLSCFMHGQWNETDKIVAFDRQSGDYFSGNFAAPSRAVSIFGDIAVVGACRDDHSGKNEAGSAYIFRKDINCKWTFVQKISADTPESQDWFGISVS